MRIIAAISLTGLVLLGGCDYLTAKATFQISSADRPVKSATLELCERSFPLAVQGSQWGVSIRVPGDCHGGVTATMADGTSVFCGIGYTTHGVGETWLFDIQKGSCKARIIFPQTADGNAASAP
jgi:hypothetical protein